MLEDRYIPPLRYHFSSWGQWRSPWEASRLPVRWERSRAPCGLVRYLNERAKREGLANLTAQVGGADDPRLPAPVDFVIMVNTYHHIGPREQYFRKVRDALKPGGRLAIIDFDPDAPIDVPDRVSRERVKQELARAGFELAQEHAFLPHQYFLILRPTAK